ncbi:Hypothetical predicted protein [Paramuricea clavata]|uniref:Uncharacterized protein n=1 Tax=Paramuricea clavata TaxID=317549 RepID=A0A6S7GP28_PARCT|nr:Hypothetical predicted protein [Paramuricea clavata]
MFADDTNITVSGKSIKEAEVGVNADLNNIREWLLSNRLSLNLVKTEYLLIGSRHNINTLEEQPRVFIGDEPIKRCARTVMNFKDEPGQSQLALDQLGWISLEERRKHIMAILMFKVVNNLAPSRFSSMFQNSNHIHSYNLRGSYSSLFLSRPNTEPQNFTFPYSYNTSDNTWHSVMLKFIKPDLTIYLDGVQRETRKYTVNKGIIIPKGVVKLGYCKDGEGMVHHFEGIISPVRQTDRISSSFNIQNEISHKCPSDTGKWKANIWKGFHLAKKSIPSCGVRREYINLFHKSV